MREPGYVPTASNLYEMCHGNITSLICKMLEYAGDEFTLQEIRRIAPSYSIVLANMITLCSPDIVSIGGGVSSMGDIFFDLIRKYTDKLVDRS